LLPDGPFKKKGPFQKKGHIFSSFFSTIFSEVDLFNLNCWSTWMVQLVAGWALGGWYVVITTDFSMENYKEFLTDALPHLDQMVVIEIDSASFT